MDKEQAIENLSQKLKLAFSYKRAEYSREPDHSLFFEDMAKEAVYQLEQAGYRLPSTAREALSDEELNKAYDGAFDKPMDFDHKPTADELHTIRLRAVSQATVKGE